MLFARSLRCVGSLTRPQASVPSLRRLASQPEALGFSSPGNKGHSEEMKEVGRPHETKQTEEATQRHLFSEKLRFDSDRFRNAERFGAGTAAPRGGDTGSEQAVGDLSIKLAKEDPVTTTGGTKIDTASELEPERDRGAMPDKFGEREGGEGGPGKISQPDEGLRDVASKVGRVGGKKGNAIKSNIPKSDGYNNDEENGNPPGGRSHVPDYSH